MTDFSTINRFNKISVGQLRDRINEFAYVAQNCFFGGKPKMEIHLWRHFDDAVQSFEFSDSSEIKDLAIEQAGFVQVRAVNPDDPTRSATMSMDREEASRRLTYHFAPDNERARKMIVLKHPFLTTYEEEASSAVPVTAPGG